MKNKCHKKEFPSLKSHFHSIFNVNSYNNHDNRIFIFIKKLKTSKFVIAILIISYLNNKYEHKFWF